MEIELSKTVPFHAFSVFPVHLIAGVISVSEPQNWAPNFSPTSYPILPMFSGMEDPLKTEGLPSQIKSFPQIASGIP